MANIIEITDISAAELDVFARLTETQLRNRLESSKGIFIAESPKVILPLPRLLHHSNWE